VVLDDIPSTPTFRMQQLQMLTEITKSLPPEAQALIIDFVIEATDLAGSQKITDRLRKGLNLPDDSPEAQQQQQAMMQEQQAIQKQQLALEMREREAKIAQIEAAAQKTLADIGQGQGSNEAVAAVQAEAQRQVQALQEQLQALQQQLFSKEIEAKANQDEITLKTHSDIEQAKIDRQKENDKEREITARELEKAKIAAQAQVEAAKLQAEAIKDAEIERLKAELAKVQAEAAAAAKEEADDSKEKESEKSDI